ncbi:MAG: lysylphosphatidylglycerol synthase transmembrane domain-containing protein [Acidobacteriota bacterium]
MANAAAERESTEARARRPSLLFPSIVFLVAVGLLFASVDVHDLTRALASFPARLLPAVLLLSIGNYALRMVRWHLYLRQIGVRVPFSTSATAFSAGLAMSVTPGKTGELVKAYGIGKLTGTPVLKVVSVILMERVSDLCGVVLLAGVGLYREYPLPVAALAGALVLGHTVLLVPPAGRLAFRLLHRLDGLSTALGKAVHKLEEAYASLASLARPGTMLMATIVAVVSWGAEGLGLYLTVLGLGGAAKATLTSIVMIYATATLLGAISPGGLVVTEATMTTLLVGAGMPLAAAVVATTICRIATLWFAVAFGCVVLFWIWPRLLRQADRNAAIPGVSAA